MDIIIQGLIMSRLDNESWDSFPLNSDAAKETAEERKKIIKERLEEAKAAENATTFDWGSNHYKNR